MASNKGLPVPLRSVILFRIGISTTSALVYITAGYYFFPFKLPVMDSVTDRLVFTLRWLIMGAFTLILAILGVAKVRGTSSAVDPIKGQAEHLVLLPQKILQNTLEQYIIHSVGQIVLCTYLSSDTMKLVPLLVMLFVIARIVYKICYEIDPLMRAYAFASILFPTLVVYLYCVFCFIVYGFSYGLSSVK